VEGNIRLHMHLSWTGSKMVELTIKAESVAGGADITGTTRITGIISETDEVRDSSEASSKARTREVCNWLVDIRLKGDVSGRVGGLAI